ncbi:MAG: hypothetical protein ACKOB3_00215 [Holophagaceae bacterium]
MRFGPAIFEAHVRTTVRENYFKWIFQQLIDTQSVKNEDVVNFQLEYDENVYKNLPKTLACSHKELTVFPYSKCEIVYGNEDEEEQDDTLIVPSSVGGDRRSTNTDVVLNDEEDNISRDYESADDNQDDDAEEEEASSVDASSSSTITAPSAAATSTTYPASSPPGQGRCVNGAAEQQDPQESGPPGVQRKKFFLIYKNTDNDRFRAVREKQRRRMKAVIEHAREEHQEILLILKKTVMDIRGKKKTLKETDRKFKDALADAKRSLRLLKDPNSSSETPEGPAKKKYRRSTDNQTRFSDTKISFFFKANDTVDKEEENGSRKSFETLYKRVWNKYVLAPKEPLTQKVAIPEVRSVTINTMKKSVEQMMLDFGTGMMEEV